MAATETVMHSPIGPLLLTADAQGLQGVAMGLTALELYPAPSGHPVLAEAVRQLSEYFAGERRGFQLPLALRGSGFQQRVWRALLEIPFGETESYGEVAHRLGMPRGARAVGLAAGRNPVAIVVPCHRVVGARGALTGFGGGLPRKAALLAHERSVARGNGGPMPPLGDSSV